MSYIKTLREILTRGGKLAADNSPAILTAVGVTGALTTAYLTGKASFKASNVIFQVRLDKTERWNDEPYEMDIKEAMKLVWKLYIPAGITAALTISAIIGANRIGTRRAAALAAVYAISERAFEEYKEKVIEKIGGTKEQQVRDSIAQDQISRNPVGSQEIIVAGAGTVLCYEAYTGRYFLSDMETLRKAQNDVNAQVLNDSYASLTDFYDLVGLPHTDNSDEVGWNSDKLMELKFSAVLTEDGRPCMSISFTVSPVRHYYRLQ